MKTKLGWYLVAGAMAIPALAGYGKDDTQIMFAFGGGANNARLYAEVLAQAERDRPGKPVVGLADRLAGHSAGAMLAAFLTLPLHAEGRPLSAGETLEHFAGHAPKILGSLATGIFPFFPKAKIQEAVQKHMAAALGSMADHRVSDLPYQTDLVLAEAGEDQLVPFNAMAAILCVACSNPEGKDQTECKEHGPSLTRMVGRNMPAAKELSEVDDTPVPILALNLQAGIATPEVNAELALVAQAQMIGRKGDRTPSYTKLLAVLAEADGGKAGSASATVETKADGQAKAATKS